MTTRSAAAAAVGAKPAWQLEPFADERWCVIASCDKTFARVDSHFIGFRDKSLATVATLRGKSMGYVWHTLWSHSQASFAA